MTTRRRDDKTRDRDGTRGREEARPSRRWGGVVAVVAVALVLAGGAAAAWAQGSGGGFAWDNENAPISAFCDGVLPDQPVNVRVLQRKLDVPVLGTGMRALSDRAVHYQVVVGVGGQDVCGNFGWTKQAHEKAAGPEEGAILWRAGVLVGETAEQQMRQRRESNPNKGDWLRELNGRFARDYDPDPVAEATVSYLDYVRAVRRFADEVRDANYKFTNKWMCDFREAGLEENPQTRALVEAFNCQLAAAKFWEKLRRTETYRPIKEFTWAEQQDGWDRFCLLGEVDSSGGDILLPHPKAAWREGDDGPAFLEQALREQRQVRQKRFSAATSRKPVAKSTAIRNSTGGAEEEGALEVQCWSCALGDIGTECSTPGCPNYKGDGGDLEKAGGEGGE